MKEEKPHVLFILPGPVPPDVRPEWNVKAKLSTFLEGTVLQPVWRFTDEDGRQIQQTEIAGIRYLLSASFGYWRPFKFIHDLLFFITAGRKVHAEKPVQLIVTYGTTRTGLAGLLLKHLLGAKLIVEVPGVPKDAYVFDCKGASVGSRLVNWVTASWTNFIIPRADRCKLLYPDQLDGIAGARKVPASSFADMVPLSQIAPAEADDRYLLCIGFPWHLKGVDLLIEAYKRLRDRYPEYGLKLFGHCEDREHFSALCRGVDGIEMGKGVSRDEAIALIRRCSVFVLPSRTEAMGRVLLEAMAAKKPIVASRAGGIPYVVQHDENGLLFDSGDVDALTEQLAKVLGDASLRERLAQTGFRRVHREFSEERYVEHYKQMVLETLS